GGARARALARPPSAGGLRQRLVKTAARRIARVARAGVPVAAVRGEVAAVPIREGAEVGRAGIVVVAGHARSLAEEHSHAVWDADIARGANVLVVAGSPRLGFADAPAAG